MRQDEPYMFGSLFAQRGPTACTINHKLGHKHTHTHTRTHTHPKALQARPNIYKHTTANSNHSASENENSGFDHF